MKECLPNPSVSGPVVRIQQAAWRSPNLLSKGNEQHKERETAW